MRTLELPTFADVMAGISGACTDSLRHRVYFSASVEDKTGTYLDGQILGSYVGWFPADASGETIVPTVYHLVDAQGNRLFDKLEAVELISESKEGIRLAGIVDNDDGSSLWLQILLPSDSIPASTEK